MTVKHSIRRQVALVFIGLMVLALLTLALCNRLFLEDFYVSSKMKILEDSMEFLNEHDIAQGSGDFSLYCTNNNLSYAVASANYSRVLHQYDRRKRRSAGCQAVRVHGGH